MTLYKLLNLAHLLHTSILFWYPLVTYLLKNGSWDALYVWYTGAIVVHWVVFGDCLLNILKRQHDPTFQKPKEQLSWVSLVIVVCFMIVWARHARRQEPDSTYVWLLCMLCLVVLAIMVSYIHHDIKLILTRRAEAARSQ